MANVRRSTVCADLFPDGTVVCNNAETRTGYPIIISPACGTSIDLVTWAEGHQQELLNAIHNVGALLFRGFQITEERIPEAFQAAFAIAPTEYLGDTPKERLSDKAPIYKSSALAPRVHLPLHQEASSSNRYMPLIQTFFCAIPPEPGTGRTTLGDTRSITEDYIRTSPDRWARMQSTTLTYEARYLPQETCFQNLSTKWTKLLNPSHATIFQRFGTVDKEEVEAECSKQGLAYHWEWSGALLVSKRNVPATIVHNGTTLLCNQLYTTINPKLCGGWGSYLAARTLLYPLSLQLNAIWDDTQAGITNADAASMLEVLERHEEGIDWQEGDWLCLNNITFMHGKTPHSDEGNKQPRRIVSVLGGFARPSNPL